MVNAHLATYLNDHLAGSVAIIELLPHMEKLYSGTDLEKFFAELYGDVSADRDTLRALMSRLEIAESTPRKAAAWFAEKAAELKLKLDDSSEGPLHLLESLEITAIGIEGKRTLWATLAASVTDEPELGPVDDYIQLHKLAESQRARVEVERLKAAQQAFKKVP